jgi:hypothetical protein
MCVRRWTYDILICRLRVFVRKDFPPRVRLRDCGAWSSALPRNSNLKKKLPARGVNFVTAIPPPHMRGLELHAPTRKKAAQPPLVTTWRG